MELRRARAWAVWALIRKAKPELPGDAEQAIREPDLKEVEAGLRAHGYPREVDVWQAAFQP